MNRVAFAGPVGKSRAAQRLWEEFGYGRRSISEAVWKIAREEFQMTVQDGVLIQTIDRTGRVLDPDVWVNKCVESLEEGISYVIDDVRFPNECIKLRAAGFLIIWLKTSGQASESLSPEHADLLWSAHMLEHHLQNWRDLREDL
jgi:hypothetical protein